MKLFAVFFVLGTAAVLSLPDLPTQWGTPFLLLTAALSTVLIALNLSINGLARRCARWISIGFFLGVGFCWYSVKTELAHKIDPKLHGSDVELLVRVEGVPVNAQGWTRFRCRVIEPIEAPEDFSAKRIQVTWYRQSDVLA